MYPSDFRPTHSPGSSILFRKLIVAHDCGISQSSKILLLGPPPHPGSTPSSIQGIENRCRSSSITQAKKIHPTLQHCLMAWCSVLKGWLPPDICQKPGLSPQVYHSRLLQQKRVIIFYCTIYFQYPRVRNKSLFSQLSYLTEADKARKQENLKI